MSKKVKEVILLLQMNGWHLDRTRGDHRIFRKQGAKRSVTVAGKESEDLCEGTYQAILKQARLKR
ncbi:MAG: type II toxin-antitoxin system HicA family toxin [Bacteroidales bacterium]|jgi:predicted RNA binding protein YcfA (HicA-like mRNA interferase family)|nr:type II toxin-antitoxin system HicA family toxin [Bacteroidales bacterium]